MKTLGIVTVVLGVLAVTVLCAQNAGGCGCGHSAAAAAPAPQAVSAEGMPQGAIENLVPITMAIVLGCEPCTETTVKMALSAGSSKEDIERVLVTAAAARKAGCFNKAFPEAVARMEKPIAAGRRALAAMQ